MNRLQDPAAMKQLYWQLIYRQNLVSEIDLRPYYKMYLLLTQSPKGKPGYKQ